VQPCRSFKADDEDDEKSELDGNKFIKAVKSMIFSKDNSIEKLEEFLSRVS